MKTLIFVFFLMISSNLMGQNLKPEVYNRKDATDKDKYAFLQDFEIKPGEIIFPNAFKWNGTGPTGGYWTENQTDDHVFRPFTRNVVNYKLKIFTRWGNLIYETTDLNKGWDGYSRDGNLAPQAVYVWIATGKFTDGNMFNKIGDVTFLH
jgi:hypothetical protein